VKMLPESCPHSASGPRSLRGYRRRRERDMAEGEGENGDEGEGVTLSWEGSSEHVGRQEGA